MFRRIPPVILIIILLAFYGFLLTFLADPINTLIVLGLSVLLFLVIRSYLQTGKFFSGKIFSRRPKDGKPYSRNPKQGGMRQAAKKQSHPPRKNHPFRVIDGKKGKPNDNQSEQDSQNNLFQ